MKRLSIIVLLAVAPLASMAQFVVFTDNFTTGSTLNKTSVPGGTPFASFTSYDIATTKTGTSSALASGKLIITLTGGTTSGMIEGQAVFTRAPVSLQTVGDYINLTYTFLNTNLLAGGSGSYIMNGLYISGGTTPVAGGGLAVNGGLSGVTGSPFATGNCQLWQGYVSRIANSNGPSSAYTRPAQNGSRTTSANQDLVGGGNTGDFDQGGGNPGAVTFDTLETNTQSLVNGQVYTISYTIVLSAAGQITVTNALYSGSGTGGSLLFSQTNTATTTNVLTTSFDGLAIGVRNAGASLNPGIAITNLVISESIAGLPGQPFDVTGGGIGCPGNSFPVGLDGSVTSNSYYLYTNGVWAGIALAGTGSPLLFTNEPISIGSAALTNTVIATNPVISASAPMLGSVVVAENPPAVITSEPIPAIVANGSIGVFSVGATGGGLTYQWYKNGTALTNGGNISGATNSTLAISPAGSGDAANYYCIATSGCGDFQISVTNSLTIGAPASITWEGNNPDSNWDLSTTANFNNGTTTVVFHNGDNVTFNDTYGEYTVNVTGNYIAPGSMTESSANTYTFNGPGVIQGPGSLLMQGPGILGINNSNAWAGGTTVTGGTLSLSNLFAVGTTAVTLSGGTLDIPFKVGSAIGVSNNINVTANSTLQYDQNGTFACVLDGVITGSSTATLNVFSSDGATGTARVRMYSPFTNNANVILTASGSLGQSEIEFAPYLSSGNQIFNGIISGNGGHIVARGAGSVILNNTNTFNDTTESTAPYLISLLNSSGNVGIGADSVQSSPPTIDASPVGVGYMAVSVGAEGGTCSFFASGGPHTIANQFIYTSATNTVTVIFGGTNNLTFSGEFDLANPPTNSLNPGAPLDSNGTNRTLNVTNTAATTFAGEINDNGFTSGFTKTGGGALYLNGTNIYAGPTTNNAGLLAGSGSIAGVVVVGTNGSIGGGPAGSIGTLTLSNNLTLNGNVFIRVDKDLSPGQSNDVVSVTGTLANGGTGTVTVTNIGTGALVVGDTFQIFSKAVSGGGSLTIKGGGAGVQWNNNLAASGTISVAAIVSGPTTNATITQVFQSGTNVVVVGTNNNVPNTMFHYAVLTSTNILIPLTNWTPLVTNPFNGTGTFDYTNPIVPGTPQQFIDILVVP